MPTLNKKILGILLAAGASVAAPMLAEAQAEFSIAGGPSYASGTYDTGYGMQGSVGFALPHMPVRLRMDGLVANIPLTFRGPGPVNVPEAETGNSTTITGLRANLVLGMPGMLLTGPYLVGGVGYYHAAEGASSASKPGASLGGGVRVAIGRSAVFGEVDYHHMNTDDGFKFVAVMVGLSFR